MSPTSEQYIELALALAALAAKAIAAVKEQQGMDNEALLARAEQRGAATREAVAAFLKGLEA